MKAFFLFCSLLLIGQFSYAQRDGTLTKAAQPKASHARPLTGMHSSSAGGLSLPGIPTATEKSLVLDTIFPTALSLECAAQPTFFFSDTSRTLGYVFGTNQFGDVEKIQRMTLASAQTFDVTEVFVPFVAMDTANILDRKVVIKIYPELTSEGSLEPALGFSDSVAVSDLNLDGASFLYSRFTFSTPVRITNASTFLVSVDLFDTYAEGSDGTIGVISTTSDCGDGTNVLEIFPNNQGGFSFNTVNANWGGLDAEMFVGAVIDVQPATSVLTPQADFQLRATPNPTSDRLQLNFRASEQQLTATLFSPAGREVRRSTVATVGGNGLVNWSVADLPAGIYLYHLRGAEGIQTGKVVVR